MSTRYGTYGMVYYHNTDTAVLHELRNGIGYGLRYGTDYGTTQTTVTALNTVHNTRHSYAYGV